MPRYFVIFVSLLLAVLSTNALAEWTNVPIELTGDSLYVDKSTIERSGTSAKMLWLNDLAHPEFATLRKSRQSRKTYTYSSKLFYAEYDCQKAEYRILNLTVYSGQMGGGEAFKISSTDKWRDISDGHQEWQVTWKIACGKK